MTEYVDIRMEDGGLVPFELDELDQPVPAGRRPRQLVDRADETLERGVARAKTIARSITGELGDLPRPPDRISVEIGLNATTEANLAIARAAAAAQIRIVLEWTQDRPDRS